MQVFLATQIFSDSVAAGMNTHLALGKLLIDSKCTISFIDKLYDIIHLKCQIANASEDHIKIHIHR